MDDDPEALNAFLPRDESGALDDRTYYPAAWLYRPGSDDEQLRYSIRSLTATLPVEEVVIVGERPPWFRGRVIPTKNGLNIRENTWRAMLVAAKELGAYVLCNDDMYCLERQRDMPIHHRGPLAAQVERNMARKPHSSYTKSMADALTVLEAHGVKNAKCFEAHTPTLIHAEPMAEAFALRKASAPLWPSKRTIYGNLARKRSTLVPGPIPGTKDVKVSRESQELPTGPWLSTNEVTWRGRAGAKIRKAFPNPSVWES